MTPHLAPPPRRAPRLPGVASACTLALAGCALLPGPRTSTASDDGSSAEATAAPAEERRAPNPTTLAPIALGSSRAADGEGLALHGYARLRLRARATGDASDHDLYATLGLDAGSPERDPVTAHVLGRFNVDLGGSDPNDLYFSLDDTRSGAINELIYFAYLDVHAIDALSKLRVGRQQLWDTPAFVVFDGVSAESEALEGFTLGAYGGLRTQYYDKSRPEDVTAGVYASTRPWESARLRVDFMHLEDEDRLGSDENDLLGIDLWQFVGERLTLEGRYTRLEGRDRDLRLDARYLDPDEDLTVRATYDSLLRTQSSQALEIDPYFSALRELRPYEQLGLVLAKGFADALSVSLGGEVRMLDTQADEGEFNHEFEHYYVSTALFDLAVDGLDVTVTGDVWQDDQQRTRTWGLDVSKELDERLTGSVGSYYSLYKYDLFLVSERDDVRTVYGRLRWDRESGPDFDVAYEFEDDDFEVYHRLTLEARWRF